MKIKKELEGNVVLKKFFVRNLSNYKYAYILLIPAILYVFVFQYLPLLGIIIAFKEYNIFDGIWKSPWVGIENFVLIFKQQAMLKAISNTLLLSTINIFGSFPFPIILAILFNELWNIKFKKVVQTISYMPYFLSWISVVGLCYGFLAKDGPLNSLLARIMTEGYESKNFLMDSKYFIPIAFLTNLWKTVGWSSVIYLAAIAGIDPALYEAATIDGAGKFRQIWHITLTSIRTTMIIIFIMSIGALFNSNFELVYGLQNVYIIDDTEVIGTLIYRTGIQNGNYSVATAFGLTQGIITVILILMANAISKKFAQISIW